MSRAKKITFDKLFKDMERHAEKLLGETCKYWSCKIISEFAMILIIIFNYQVLVKNSILRDPNHCQKWFKKISAVSFTKQDITSKYCYVYFKYFYIVNEESSSKKPRMSESENECSGSYEDWRRKILEQVDMEEM